MGGAQQGADMQGGDAKISSLRGRGIKAGAPDTFSPLPTPIPTVATSIAPYQDSSFTPKQ